MNEISISILALIAGFVLGAFFFGGLWYTLKKSVTAKSPALWIIGGSLSRISIALIGFYYVSMGSWQRLVVCLFGFIAARVIVMRITKTNDQKSMRLKMKINHEA